MRTLLKSVDSAASEGFDLDQTCSEAVSSITDDVCRPLRTRVEQILLLEAGPVVLYKLVQLIRDGLSLRSFYTSESKKYVIYQLNLISDGLGSNESLANGNVNEMRHGESYSEILAQGFTRPQCDNNNSSNNRQLPLD